MKTEEFFCDLCSKKLEFNNDNKEYAQRNIPMQCIFTTEQDEGRSVKYYLAEEKIDICPKCTERRISGESIFAHGAQGYNKYYFKTDVK